MKILKSLIKKIDRFVPLKETAISLLVCSIALILVEFIWDGSVAGLLNMNQLAAAAILLAYLILVTVLIKYIMRFMRIRRRNLGRLRDRVLEEQEGRGDTARIVMKAVLLMLIMLPIIMLTLISVETLWEGSVSYHINLNALIISTIAAELIAIIAVMVMLYRSRLRTGRSKPRRPAPRPLAPEIRAERAAAGLSTPAAATAPAETMAGHGKRRWTGRVARVAPMALLLVFLGAILIALAVGSIWEDSIPGHMGKLRIAAVVLTVIAVWFNRGRANTSLLFMISVIFLTLPQLMNVVMYFEETPTVTLRINSFLNTFSPIAIAAGAIAGMTYVHRNRDKITTIFEKKKNGESISRNRNLLYKLLPLILLLLALALTLPGLGDFEFREDEFQVVDAAAGYYHTGDFYKWDWLENAPSDVYYDRAWPHTFMIAMSYKLFGISEWASRIVSVFWFVILILAAYLVTKKVINKELAFVFAMIIAMYPSYIFVSRYTRMYIVLIPIFFIAAYFLYRGLFTGKPHARFRIISGLRLNYLYLILGALLLYFSYLIHLSTMIYIFGFFTYMVVWMTKNKYWAYLKPVGVLGIAAIIIFFMILFTDINIPGTHFAGLPDTPRYSYINNLFQYPFGVGITMILLFTGIPIFWRKAFLLYSFLLPISALIVMVFFTTRYSGWSYICNFTPFVILLSSVSLYFLITVLFKRKLFYRFTLIFISLFIIISGFCLEVPRIYKEANPYGNFKEAYEVINENYTEDEVIIGQYLRTYYINPVNAEKPQVVSMLSNRKWTFEEFMDNINSHDSGWITWETRKSYHITAEIRNYIVSNFEKLHGTGIDDTGVEVYRFDNYQ